MAKFCLSWKIAILHVFVNFSIKTFSGWLDSIYLAKVFLEDEVYIWIEIWISSFCLKIIIFCVPLFWFLAHARRFSGTSNQARRCEVPPVWTCRTQSIHTHSHICALACVQCPSLIKAILDVLCPLHLLLQRRRPVHMLEAGRLVMKELMQRRTIGQIL